MFAPLSLRGNEFGNFSSICRVLNGGRYYWEINVSQRIFGTSMMFGIGTRRARSDLPIFDLVKTYLLFRLHVDAFVNMLGEEESSWGLSHKGLLWHAGRHKTYIKPFRENVATTIGIYFDGISGNLTFFKDGHNLGVAFTGLHEVAPHIFHHHQHHHDYQLKLGALYGRPPCATI